jgi:hypothetical protein
MAKPNLAKMSVDALLKLRADVGTALSRRVKELESQLSWLGGEIGSRGKTRQSSLKGRKVAVNTVTSQATRGPVGGLSPFGFGTD